MSVTREELVGRARDLTAVVRERAEKTEQLRRIPEETFQLFKQAELLRALVPREFGGFDLELATAIETSRELARGCGSSGWCLAICTLHNWMVAGMPNAAQQEVFGPGPDSVVAGVFMPGGSATPADGGFRLSGQWNFASGCDHASHALLAGLIQPDPEKPPIGLRTFLVRRQDFAIEDNWHVAGLEGTGSKRIVVSDIFVPDEWTTTGMKAPSAGEQASTRSAGSRRRLPTNSVATLGLAGVPIGIAREALVLFQERLATKLRVGSLRANTGQIGAQFRLAESAAEVDAVQLLVMRDFDEMERVASSGEPPTREQRGRYRRDAAYTFQTCARAVARLLPASGSTAVFNDNPLQRALRDTQVMATHMVADWDTSRETYASSLLELEIADPVF